MIRGNTPPCLADLPTRAYPLPSNSLEIWMPPSYWHHQKVSNWLCASGNGFIDWSQLRFSSLYSCTLLPCPISSPTCAASL